MRINLGWMAAAVVALACGADSAMGQTFNPTSGTQSWNVNSNWSTGIFPNATGASATFQSPTATEIVNLNVAITIGSINFTNNGTNLLTLANGTAGSLIFDETGSGPATVVYNGTNSVTNNITISASVSLTDSLTVTNNNVAGTTAATMSFTGTITGAGGFTKDGSGRLTSSTVSKAFTGATVVNFGRLRFTASGQFTGTSSILVNSGGSLYLDSSPGAWSFGTAGTTVVTINGDGDGGGGTGTQGALRNQGSGTNTFANAVVLGSNATIHTDGTSILELTRSISGSDILTKSGAGTLRFTASNATLTGGLNVQNGTVTTLVASNIGTGSLTFAQTTGNNTAVTLANATQSISSLSSVWIDTTGTRTQTLTLTGTALTINQSTNTTFGPGAVDTLTSVIAGTGSVIKSGIGTLTLGNANTYSGGTTINGGLLLVANATGSGTGSGGVAVNNNGTFGGTGTGTVSGATTVNIGGTIRGGNATSDGTLNLSSLAVDSNGTLATKIATTSTTANSLAIAGALRFDPNGKIFVNTNNVAFPASGGPYTFTIATYGSSPTAINVTDQSRFSFSSDFTNSGDFTYSLTGGTAGGNLVLTFSPVPEPGTLFALGAAGLGLIGGVRRLRAKPATV